MSEDWPLTLDEVAALPDVPASEEMPPEMAEEFAGRRLPIFGVEDDEQLAAGVLRRVADGVGEWELRLPTGAVVGRPGREFVELERSELENGDDQDSAQPFRPEWVPLSYQPRRANESPRRPILQSVDGTLVRPMFIFPPDDRTVYTPNTYPFHCTGRVFLWENWEPEKGPDSYGSAALIGPRHVLTARHVVEGASGPKWRMLFIPAYWDGSSWYGPGARSFVSHVVVLGGGSNMTARDVAVLRLEADLGNVLGFLGAIAYDSRWTEQDYWTKTGYPFDVGMGGLRPSYQRDIAVLVAKADGTALELDHVADIAGGNSGGPLWGVFERGLPRGRREDDQLHPIDGPYVIGVTSGSYWNRNTGVKYNTDAGGQTLVNIVRWVRDNLP